MSQITIQDALRVIQDYEQQVMGLRLENVMLRRENAELLSEVEAQQKPTKKEVKK